MMTPPKPKPVHLYVGGRLACRGTSYEADEEATDPDEVTCRTCRRTKAFEYYNLGWGAGRSSVSRKLLSSGVIETLIGLTGK